MCSCPIRLQDSIIINISGTKQCLRLFIEIGTKKRIVSNTTTVGCDWPGIFSHTVTYLNLSGGDFGWFCLVK